MVVIVVVVVVVVVVEEEEEEEEEEVMVVVVVVMVEQCTGVRRMRITCNKRIIQVLLEFWYSGLLF